jgi:O-antigen/teichoic acid export membrane protein
MPGSMGSLQLLAVDLVPVVVKDFLRKSLQGAQKLKEASVAGIAGFAMRNSVAILLLMLGLGIEGILVGWIVGDLLESMIGLRYALGVFSGWCHTPFPLREVSAYSGPLYGSNILNYLSATVDRYLVLLLGSASLLGLYSPAISGANLLGMIPVAVSAALFPAFSGIAAKDASKIGQAASVTQKWLFVIFMPIAVGLALEASAFVLIVAGPAYIDAAPALVILALTAGITAHHAVVESVLLGSGKTRILLVSNMIAFLAGFISAIMLIPSLGLVGAALSRAVLRIVQTSLPLGVLAKKGVIQFNWTGFIKPVVACLGMAFAVMTIQRLASGLMLVFVEVLIGVLVYGLFLRLLRVLTYEDIQIIREMLPKRLKWLAGISEKLLVTKHAQVQQEKANLTSAQPE